MQSGLSVQSAVPFLRRVPRYTTKRVQDGFTVEEVTVPRYEWREVTIGWEEKSKKVPVMATKQVKVGTKVDWELVAAPGATEASKSTLESVTDSVGGAKIAGLARITPTEGPHGTEPRRPSWLSQAIWDSLGVDAKEKMVQAATSSQQEAPGLSPSIGLYAWRVMDGSAPSPNRTRVQIEASPTITLSGRYIGGPFYSPSADINATASAELTAASSPFEVANPSSLDLELEGLSPWWFLQAYTLVRSWLGHSAYIAYMERQSPNVELKLHYSIRYAEGLDFRGVTIENESSLPVSLDNVHVQGGSTNLTLLPSEVNTHGGLFHMPVTVHPGEADAIPLAGTDNSLQEILPLTATAYLIIDGKVVPVSWRISTYTGKGTIVE